MNIVVHYHAFLREKLGLESELFAFSEEAVDAGAVLDAFFARHPEYSRLSHGLKIAVDEEIAGRTVRVVDGSRVDLLPPYGGG